MELLDFELRHPVNDGRKEDAIRVEFGVGFARYQQMLGSLLDSDKALADRPIDVYRLLEARERRANQRADRSVALRLPHADALSN